MISRAQMAAEVAQEKRSAKFVGDVHRNTGVIRHRMADGYDKWFALYDGDDAQGMVDLLRSRGFEAKNDGGAWCKL